MGSVAALYRYPVKSMLGEAVSAVAVTERGFRGDRTHAVLDGTGAVASAKHPRKWGALLRLPQPVGRPRQRTDRPARRDRTAGRGP
ncbi:MOSC N-terminal beta barrel domain-containing protein [Streptomyces sp. NRRL B-3229]|uniref:MOSC N-terminal beta barrel domain-containing protein n=1 Tax=Streptomyces sp. NRRL B-3229 TaxID=1463836 RepID=UPI002D21B025|nr:MOSC N-terminal beta barrel domain-containing protein [Streptomyces sp. NRRL B-3229]